jgi:hypothetical protein
MVAVEVQEVLRQMVRFQGARRRMERLRVPGARDRRVLRVVVRWWFR